MVNLKNMIPKYFLLYLLINIQGSNSSKPNTQRPTFPSDLFPTPSTNTQFNEPSSLNIQNQIFTPLKESTQIKKIERNLNATTCLIENCEICYSTGSSCKTCKKNYKIKEGLCVSAATEDSSAKKHMRIIIIMAFISVPLILILFCCFIYLFFRKKPSTNTNRRVFSESMITEMNGLRSRDPRLSRQNIDLVSGDLYINSVSNLMITHDNFPDRFPLFEFTSELLSENCSICFEQFNDTSVLRITPCHHIFHHDCLYEWLVTNDQKRCPNDNTKLA